jgi:hypothetical protein
VSGKDWWKVSLVMSLEQHIREQFGEGNHERGKLATGRYRGRVRVSFGRSCNFPSQMILVFLATAIAFLYLLAFALGKVSK